MKPSKYKPHTSKRQIERLRKQVLKGQVTESNLRGAMEYRDSLSGITMDSRR